MSSCQRLKWCSGSIGKRRPAGVDDAGIADYEHPLRLMMQGDDDRIPPIDSTGRRLPAWIFLSG